MDSRQLDRFRQKIAVDPKTGCWLWTASVDGGGYAQFQLDGRRSGSVTSRRPQKGHRVAYEHWRGSIPDDLVPDHVCRERRCVNPWHLELVTRKTNVQRMGSRGGTSKHRGVSYDATTRSSKKWRAQVMADGKNHNVGRFMTEGEAAMAAEEFRRNIYDAYIPR